jgi:hypothetical protein
MRSCPSIVVLVGVLAAGAVLGCGKKEPTSPAPGGQDTSPPTAPQNLRATVRDKGFVWLEWAPSADNVAVTGYVVFRDGRFLATTAGPSHLDTLASLWVVSTYAVVATDGRNQSTISAAVQITPRLSLEDVAGYWTGSLRIRNPIDLSRGTLTYRVSSDSSVSGVLSETPLVGPDPDNPGAWATCRDPASVTVSGRWSGQTLDLVVAPGPNDGCQRVEAGSLRLDHKSWNRVEGTFTLSGTQFRYGGATYPASAGGTLACAPGTAPGSTPSCQLSATALDFGTVSVDQSVERPLTITNVGGGILSGRAAPSGCDWFQMVGSPDFALAFGQSATFTIRFTPPSSRAYTCYIFTSGSPCPMVTLTGQGR